jgi:hypothetical protein
MANLKRLYHETREHIFQMYCRMRYKLKEERSGKKGKKKKRIRTKKKKKKRSSVFALFTFLISLVWSLNAELF